ncbi:MAG: hypothetical protein D6712_20955 [Chloroflexi bacterium]|nr:MAG: hypothetical protein D6712_20955 [Chloroflexota bacterium]
MKTYTNISEQDAQRLKNKVRAAIIDRYGTAREYAAKNELCYYNLVKAINLSYHLPGYWRLLMAHFPVVGEMVRELRLEETLATDHRIKEAKLSSLN